MQWKTVNRIITGVVSVRSNAWLNEVLTIEKTTNLNAANVRQVNTATRLCHEPWTMHQGRSSTREVIHYRCSYTLDTIYNLTKSPTLIFKMDRTYCYLLTLLRTSNLFICSTTYFISDFKLRIFGGPNRTRKDKKKKR